MGNKSSILSQSDKDIFLHFLMRKHLITKTYLTYWKYEKKHWKTRGEKRYNKFENILVQLFMINLDQIINNGFPRSKDTVLEGFKTIVDMVSIPDIPNSSEQISVNTHLKVETNKVGNETVSDSDSDSGFGMGTGNTSNSGTLNFSDNTGTFRKNEYWTGTGNTSSYSKSRAIPVHRTHWNIEYP